MHPNDAYYFIDCPTTLNNYDFYGMHFLRRNLDLVLNKLDDYLEAIFR